MKKIQEWIPLIVAIAFFFLAEITCCLPEPDSVGKIHLFVTCIFYIIRAIGISIGLWIIYKNYSPQKK